MQYFVYITRIQCILYIQKVEVNTVGVMLRGEGGGISRAARWSRNWFCPAAQGQIRYITETNTLHQREKQQHTTILGEDITHCLTTRDDAAFQSAV